MAVDTDPRQRQLWMGLAELERDLGDHLAAEVDVLFPRALAGEDPQRPGVKIGVHAPRGAPHESLSPTVAPPPSRG